MDDLEEMMMLEAIRLSLASEEERARKEEKEAAKKAKKEEKEQAKQRKKEEKAARKGGGLLTAPSNVDGASSFMERSRSNLSSIADEETSSGKGKGVETNPTPPIGITRPDEETPRPYLPYRSQSETSQESLAPSLPIPSPSEPLRRSHLRQMSNASSTSSSIGEPPPSGSFQGSATPPAGNLEPTFNFQSLAAMIGEDDKADGSSHVEVAEDSTSSNRPGSLEELREAAGDTIIDQPSPQMNNGSQSSPHASPRQKGKEVVKVNERHENKTDVTDGVEMSKSSEASKA